MLSRDNLAQAILNVLSSTPRPLNARDILREVKRQAVFNQVTKHDVNSVLYGELTRQGKAKRDDQYNWTALGKPLPEPKTPEQKPSWLPQPVAPPGPVPVPVPVIVLPPKKPTNVVEPIPHSRLQKATANDEPFDFGDMFGGEEIRRQIDEMASRFRVNESSVKADFTYDADSEQRHFIDSSGQTIRLLAPAGAGKTQSIVNKVLNTVAKGLPLSRFLVLTFDNAAGLSLRDKFASGIQNSGLNIQGDPEISTLNSFGYRLINGQLRDVVGSHSVATSKEQSDAIRDALQLLKDKHPQLYGLLPRKLQRNVYRDLISILKNQIIVVDRLLAKNQEAWRQFITFCQKTQILDPWLLPFAGGPQWETSTNGIFSAITLIYSQYSSRLRQARRIDFDDQKLLPYLALACDRQMVDAIMGRYSVVIVDEFQDINRLDFELVRLLATGKQLIVVGDDDQAIYAFRGCSPDFIINFNDQANRQTETHILSTNYRCPSNIVDMANRLICRNERRVIKTQRAARGDVADVKLWHCLNCASEAQIVARHIKKLYLERHNKGFQYSDVAILLRMNSQSLPLQIALILADIPYHCRKEDNVIVSELMRKLIGLVGLHLKLRQNGAYCSLSDTELVCSCLVRYVNRTELDSFHREVVRHGGYQRASRFEQLRLPKGLTRADLYHAIDNLMKVATPLELVERISTYFRHMGGMIGTLEEALDDALPLGELVEIASRFNGDVTQFYEMLEGLLEKVQGGLFHEGEGDAVNIITYFRAKGRQWNTVFLPGVNQKIIPLIRSNRAMMPTTLEDERRLFYVAITRATSNLIVSFVRSAVRSKVEPSQFIVEMGLENPEEKRSRVIG